LDMMNRKDKKIEVICSWCGKVKKVKPYTYKRNQRFFCDGTTGNSECRRKWESEFLTGTDNPGYKERITVKCAQCGSVKKIKPGRYLRNTTGRFFCNVKKCQAEWMKKNNDPSKSTLWKGGVKEMDIPLYDTYANQLDFTILCRRSSENEDYLEIQCSACGKWHSPSLAYLRRVLSAFNHKGTDLKMYCSDECKQVCSIFGQRKYPKGFRPSSIRSEVLDPELREMVLIRDGYECQKCGSQEDLEIHHIEGVAQSPMIANDMENCLTVCENCHKEIHSQPGCTYFDYQRIACESIEQQITI
jgi:hypothetical protein